MSTGQRDLIIRRAGPDDALSIATIQVRSWQEAYRPILPAAYLYGLDPHARTSWWTELLVQPQWPLRGTLVSAQGDSIVGFASLRPSPDDNADPALGEVAALYVLPGRWRTGVGRRLMSQALATLADAEFAEAVLWVFEANARARRFYEAVGWRPDGERRQDDIAGLAVAELRYRRPLPTRGR